MQQKEPPESVSEATTHRLSLLLRSLRVLEAEGVGTVSSQQLAERFGMNPAQIRKDLAQFGEFGVRGVGYHVPDLKAKLKQLMGLERTRVVVIAGAFHGWRWWQREQAIARQPTIPGAPDHMMLVPSKPGTAQVLVPLGGKKVSRA